ncbi:MAG: VOC family protein [Nakamurella sp.]
MTERTITSSYRVSPYRFTDRPAEVRGFLEAVGLQPVITKDGFAVLRGAAGLVVVHPLATADTTDHMTTSFCLETDDARAAAEALVLDGLPARWWDESFGRQAAIAGPGAEISVNEPMIDSYGYTAHLLDGPPRFVVDVVAVFFTPHLDHWEAFFHRLGFTTAATTSGWCELSAAADSGVIGLHASRLPAQPPDRNGLSFKTSEPLPDFVARMRGLGYQVTEEPEAQAPHVTVTDPDGDRIEIHQR